MIRAKAGSLSDLWTDHRLSRTTTLELYWLPVFSSLTHCCTAWTITSTVVRKINGFNSRCLHVITGEDYRTAASAFVYDLVLAVRKQCLRYLGHVLRLPPDRVVRSSLMAFVKGGTYYPEGSLFSDCEDVGLPNLEAMASNRSVWRAKVACVECVYQ